jgi:UDP-N-acetylmuramoyl-tripeptide--D-alanyl-D-alanine ligase
MKSFAKRTIISIVSWQAAIVLKKYQPKIVVVTGSVGKTSAKDAIYAVLTASFFVRKSQKVTSTRMSVPLAVLGRPHGWDSPWLWLLNILAGFRLMFSQQGYPQWLVLEMGVERPGDIEKITSWLKPDIVVITKVGEVPEYVEYFASSPEAVLQEKTRLISALKEEGTLILNHDDESTAALAELFRGRTLFYGLKPGAEIAASHPTVAYATNPDGTHYPIGMSFDLSHLGNTIPLVAHDTLGAQQVYPAMAGATVGLSLGLSLLDIAEGFSTRVPEPGRMRIIEGLKQSLIIDDTKDSSPVALHEALTALERLKVHGRKIAILGDMLELGKFSVEEHRKAGTFAATFVNMLITVGIRSRAMADAAIDQLGEQKVLQFDTPAAAGIYLKNLIGRGDTILVKGSALMHMEQAVEEIMAHPEQKEVLLVRQ